MNDILTTPMLEMLRARARLGDPDVLVAGCMVCLKGAWLDSYVFTRECEARQLVTRRRLRIIKERGRIRVMQRRDDARLPRPCWTTLVRLGHVVVRVYGPTKRKVRAAARALRELHKVGVV